MLSVLIVEDHQLVRQGLKQVISQEYRDVVFGEAETAARAADMLAKRAWDLVLLDISLPDQDGFSVLEIARSRRPESRVLMISMHPEQLYGVRARELGASGYVCKSRPRSELLKAVKAVLSGRGYFTVPATADSGPASRPLHEDLSPQEYKVLLALAAGKRPIDIAAEMDVSIKTVSTYKQRVLKKMDLNSTAELVRYAIDNRLL